MRATIAGRSRGGRRVFPRTAGRRQDGGPCLRVPALPPSRAVGLVTVLNLLQSLLPVTTSRANVGCEQFLEEVSVGNFLFRRPLQTLVTFDYLPATRAGTTARTRLIR